MDQNKCPICGKQFNTSWQVMNHIRMSRTQGHGPVGEIPDGDNIKQYLTMIKHKQPSEDVKQDTGIQDLEPLQVEIRDGEVKIINTPKKKKIETLVCPDCGAPKSDWIKTDQAGFHGISVSEEQQRIYQYVCPDCHELIRTKGGDDD